MNRKLYYVNKNPKYDILADAISIKFILIEIFISNI